MRENAFKNIYDDLVLPKALVTYGGNVQLYTIGNLNVKVDLDLSTFPYDSQTCKMRIASWSHNTEAITIAADSEEYALYLAGEEFQQPNI